MSNKSRFTWNASAALRWVVATVVIAATCYHALNGRLGFMLVYLFLSVLLSFLNGYIAGRGVYESKGIVIDVTDSSQMTIDAQDLIKEYEERTGLSEGK